MLLYLGVTSVSAYADTEGRVYPFPHADDTQDIHVEMPCDDVARVDYKSEPFYAILLQTVPRCSVTEKQWRDIQKRFPDNKVFATRYQCDDEANFNYTNVDAEYGFIGVYAGRTKQAAQKLLEQIKVMQAFPDANIRSMQAVLEYP
jgi:hypothetical protein